MFTKNARLWFDYITGITSNEALLEHKPKNAYNGAELASVYGRAISNLYDILGIFTTSNIKVRDTDYSYYRDGVVFGTGTGTVSENDTTLFGDHITVINSSNITFTRTVWLDEQGRRNYQANYTISNTTQNDITIGEIGLTYSFKENSNGSYNYGYLFEHSVLETPITIPAGGVGRVTYNIIMEYPSST